MTYDKPLYQQFHVKGVQYIAPIDAYNLAKDDKAIILDVRDEFEMEHQKFTELEVLHIPLLQLIDRLNELPKDKQIYIICTVGLRSAKAVNLLKHQDFSNVANVDGGYKAAVEFYIPMICKDGCGSGTCTCDCGSC